MDERFTAAHDADYDADVERSVDMDLTRWKRRPVRHRVEEAAFVPIRRFL
jgi:cardiolipin synthase